MAAQEGWPKTTPDWAYTKMSEERIIRRFLSDLRPSQSPSQTDWARIERQTDAEIVEQIASDPDVAPLLNAEWFARADVRVS